MARDDFVALDSSARASRSHHRSTVANRTRAGSGTRRGLADGGEHPRGRIREVAARRHPVVHDRRAGSTLHAVARHDARPGVGHWRDGAHRAGQHRHRALHGLRRQLGQRVLLVAHARAGLPADGRLSAGQHAGNPGKAAATGSHRRRPHTAGPRAPQGAAARRGSAVDAAGHGRPDPLLHGGSALDRRPTTGVGAGGVDATRARCDASEPRHRRRRGADCLLEGRGCRGGAGITQRLAGRGTRLRPSRDQDRRLVARRQFRLVAHRPR